MPPTKFPKDFANVSMQVFTPSRVVTITPDDPWTPDSTDRAFFSTEEVAEFTIIPKDGTPETVFRLPENFIIGISEGQTFIFSDNSINLIVVM